MSEKYGPTEVRNRSIPNEGSQSINYWAAVKPIIDNRCVVCHACYDAPCQAKLTSPEGIDRGASKDNVYQTRLTAGKTTRLGIDAHSTEEWRKKGFYPILNERRQDQSTNRAAGIIYRLLELKRKHPLPHGKTVPDSLNLSIDRTQFCPMDTELEAFEKENPLWGMPFGFPGLSDAEFKTITTWLEAGALFPPTPVLPDEIQNAIASWEQFLNGDSLKEQLMSRYIYEHLFLGDIYFEGLNGKHYFRLVRSKTPPGQAVEQIATRRPTDSPGVDRPFYRLIEYRETIVSKSFLPYPLSEKRMQRWRELFLQPSYEVKKLPSYDLELATNPFRSFEALPTNSRYRFLLDDTQFFIAGFMKGPVCRGQVALSVIQDQFWVVFVDPKSDPVGKSAKFLSEQSDNLRLPASLGSSTMAVLNWRHFSASQKKYVKAKHDFLDKVARAKDLKPTLDFIWDGDKTNPNAALTVFRNLDSASVVSGLIGPDPKTVWVMGYPLLERIHYLLTADFDVYGNYAHQLLTRLYMDFMRIEAENSFLMLLPTSVREKEHAWWYRGMDEDSKEYELSRDNFNWLETGVKYVSGNPKQELLEKLRERLGQLSPNAKSIAANSPLGSLGDLHGRGISHLAETSIVRIKRANGKDQIFTLIPNRAHANVAVLFLDEHLLLPDEDTLSVYPGIAGSYPNIFFVIDESQVEEFVTAVSSLKTADDYSRLLDNYGIRRTDPDFWTEGDWFQQAAHNAGDHDIGLLDYSRYDNR